MAEKGEIRQNKIMVARIAAHSRMISTRARPGERNPKKIIDQAALSAS